MSAAMVRGRVPAEHLALPADATRLIDVVACLAARLGYRTDLRRLPAAVTEHPTGVATWLATGARYATVIALIGVGEVADGERPDLLHAAGLASISGAHERYAATAATVFGEACDALSGTGLVRYTTSSS